ITMVFNLFDTDEDGQITANELTAVLRNLGFRPSEHEVGAILKEGDEDGNGTLDLSEFISMMARIEKVDREEKKKEKEKEEAEKEEEESKAERKKNKRKREKESLSDKEEDKKKKARSASPKRKRATTPTPKTKRES